MTKSTEPRIVRAVGNFSVSLPRGVNVIATRPLASKMLSKYPVFFLDRNSGDLVSRTKPFDFDKADALKRAFNREWEGRPWN